MFVWVCVSEGEGDPLTTTLQLRQEVRQAIMLGQIVPAMEQLSQHCPLVLQGHTCSDEVQFHLRCQQYIEFIRSVPQGHASHTQHFWLCTPQAVPCGWL